jgi:cobalt-zinc-cadmium efflux system membrane fusion protein
MGGVARVVGLAVAAIVIAAGAYALFFPNPWRSSDQAGTRAVAAPAAKPPSDANSVTLGEGELKTVKVEEVGTREFRIARDAVGKIAFNDDATVPVFPPYQGRITQLFAKPGDDVAKGQIMFEIDSPDLVNAESALITAAGNVQQTRGQLDLTTRALARAKALVEAKAAALKDYEQATADFTAADASYKAALGALNGARDAVRIFGKSDAEIRKVEQTHSIDSRMPVPSPIAAKVTTRQAGPGQFVQPGGNPVYTVADLSAVWMIAKVAETDIPLIHVGQETDVKVMAFPGRTFRGKVTYIASSVDPDTHRVLVRSEVPDPGHELLPEMFANFVIRTGEAYNSPAVPVGGVVREGDGTMTVWATADGKRFDKRPVRIGLQQDDYDQVLEGLKAGERVATDGALFLDNALTSASR